MSGMCAKPDIQARSVGNAAVGRPSHGAQRTSLLCHELPLPRSRATRVARCGQRSQFALLTRRCRTPADPLRRRCHQRPGAGRGACSRGSWSGRAPSSAASRAGCGQELEFATSRRQTAPPHGRAEKRRIVAQTRVPGVSVCRRSVLPRFWPIMSVARRSIR
jgi:hypothetical protein